MTGLKSDPEIETVKPLTADAAEERNKNYRGIEAKAQ